MWLDRFELRVGDSLRERIDESLAQSRFGIVILSPSFLAKGWPKRELNGLFALEESGRKGDLASLARDHQSRAGRALTHLGRPHRRGDQPRNPQRRARAHCRYPRTE